MVILPNSQRLRSSCGCLRRCEQRDSLLVAGILRFKDQFIKTEEMSLRYKWQGCGLDVGKLQKALTGSDFRQRQRDFLFCMRSKVKRIRISNRAGGEYCAVHSHFVGEHEQILQIRKVHVVAQHSFSGGCIKGNDANRAKYIFKFHQPSVRGTIRVNEAIHAEIAVVRVFSVVAAVGIFFLSVNRLAKINCMVAPFPDKAAAGTVIGLDDFKIVFKIARAVAHRMAVFTHDKRLGAVSFKVSMDVRDCRVHPAEQIQIAEIIFAFIRDMPCALIMCQACIVKGFGPF